MSHRACAAASKANVAGTAGALPFQAASAVLSEPNMSHRTRMYCIKRRGAVKIAPCLPMKAGLAPVPGQNNIPDAPSRVLLLQENAR